MQDKLKQLRVSKGISQTFVSKKLGFKYSSGYSNIENGIRKPSLETAKKIADIFNKTIEEIFFG
ncbi:transcriptional regulator [Bacillus cereus]|nr:transcriptional regulator [Bacillus cereus]